MWLRRGAWRNIRLMRTTSGTRRCGLQAMWTTGACGRHSEGPLAYMRRDRPRAREPATWLRRRMRNMDMRATSGRTLSGIGIGLWTLKETRAPCATDCRVFHRPADIQSLTGLQRPAHVLATRARPANGHRPSIRTNSVVHAHDARVLVSVKRPLPLRTRVQPSKRLSLPQVEPTTLLGHTSGAISCYNNASETARPPFDASPPGAALGAMLPSSFLCKVLRTFLGTSPRGDNDAASLRQKRVDQTLGGLHLNAPLLNCRWLDASPARDAENARAHPPPDGRPPPYYGRRLG